VVIEVWIEVWLKYGYDVLGRSHSGKGGCHMYSKSRLPR
jgi:hypothetical protein